MSQPSADQHGVAWLTFALMTVVAWGLYGVLLHSGQGAMGDDPVSGRYKAFLWVGIAYFLTAVLAPLVMLWMAGANWSMPAKGIWLSLAAGLVGAIGAFCVLLAFGAKGSPAVVMSIIFAGAPIINALVFMAIDPPAGGLSAIRWPFVVGILMAALGGCLVSLYKPPPGHAKPNPTSVQTDTPSSP